ncbi:MAG: AI-2E family transporter [Caldimonas sp.]
MTSDTPSPDTPAAEPAEDEPPHVVVHVPVGVRSLALVVLAVLASVVALHWAQAVIVPVLLGLMFSYALTPIADALVRWHLPRAAAAGLVVATIVGLVAWGGWSIRNDAEALIDALPEMSQKVRQAMEGSGPRRPGTIDKVQEAAAEIAKAAETPAIGASAVTASGSGVVRSVTVTQTKTTVSAPARVVVERPAFNVREYLWTGALGVMTFFGQTAIVLLVTFFLLASGNTFRRKMVKLAGPTLSQKRVIVVALDEVTEQIQLYLLVQLATSAIVGAATGLAFYALGLNHAALWGVAAGVTNLIPYLGAVLVGVGSSVVAVLQFGNLDTALYIGASSFGIHAIVGNLITPWLTGRANRMSPFVVFVGVVAFGWLWGAAGLILGVPILLVVKAVCDRVEEFKPVGEFLGA